MGTFKKGILGGFSGKVGTVIGASWRGLDVMRSLPKKNNALPTEAQLEQRIKFGLMISFLSPIKNIIDRTYGTPSGSKSKFNLAMGYHLQEAVSGISPNFEVNYMKVVMSKGELLSPVAAAVAINNPSEVDFTWDNNSGTGLSNDDDKGVFLVYNPAKKLYVALESAINRQDLAATLEVPLIFSGNVVHCWMSFISASGKDSSTSVYLGAAKIT